MSSKSVPESSTVHSDLDTYLSERAAVVEAFMESAVPPDTTPPETISRAVRYSLFAGGKRLRPILVLAAAEAVGGRLEDALPAAAAFEMVHTYSLIHDDLPAMDDDSLRRGRPTSHVVFGDAVAILAGDALQTHAFTTLSRPIPHLPAERQLRAIQLLSEASGASGMVGGQVADLEAEGRPTSATELDFIHRHKTGALIRAAAAVGGVVGGGDDDAVSRLTRYGENIGLAFQIVDDILDVIGTPETLGKSAGKDAEADKATYPRVHGIEEARNKARERVEAALAALEPFDQRAEPLALLAHRIVDRSS